MRNVFFGGMMQGWRPKDTFRYRDKERRRKYLKEYMRVRRRMEAHKRMFLKKHPTVLTLP